MFLFDIVEIICFVNLQTRECANECVILRLQIYLIKYSLLFLSHSIIYVSSVFYYIVFVVVVVLSFLFFASGRTIYI